MAEKGSDPTWSLMLFIGVLIGIGWVLWYFFQNQMMEAVRYVRVAEMAPIALVDSRAQACLDWLIKAPVGETHMPTAGLVQSAQGCFPGLDEVARTDPKLSLKYYNLTPQSLGVVSDVTGNYIRWPAALICAAIGVYAMFYSPRNKFKTRYDLEGFIKIQSTMWPVISPIVNFKPAEHSARIRGAAVPDVLPPFAEALSPEEWLAFHRIPVANGIPEREAVRRALVMQLGPRWTGGDKMPAHIKALLAAFTLKGTQKREESDDLLGRIALGWSHQGGLQIPAKLQGEIDAVFSPSAREAVEAIALKHAYRTTALLGVLKWARAMGGVLAPAQFLWLRAEDRPLWYALNNLGRRSFHAEGAGALAHFMAEEGAGKPLVIPRIDTAIVTLNQYLASTGATVPPRDEPKSGRAVVAT